MSGKTCIGPGHDGGLCGRKHEAKGLCNGHYQQQKAGKELTPLRRTNLGLTDEQARARAAEIMPNFYTLVPFPGVSKPWPGVCMDCGHPIKPRLDNVLVQGSCTYCSGNRIDDAIAVGKMMAMDLEPLEPYPGRDSIPWQSKCMKCGALCSPRYTNIKQGQGGCSVCAETGFKSHLPGVFYFISGTGKATGLDMIKCGIANTHCHEDRLSTHRRQGLDNVHHVIHFDLGADAEAMEGKWKDYLKGLPAWTRPTKDDLPKGGWTEAVMAHGPHILWIERNLLPLAV